MVGLHRNLFGDMGRHRRTGDCMTKRERERRRAAIIMATSQIWQVDGNWLDDDEPTPERMRALARWRGVDDDDDDDDD
jgi:hypothetical protein